MTTPSNSSIKPNDAIIKTFMAKAAAALGQELPDPKDVFNFGDSDPKVSDELLALAVSGAKTTTTSWPIPDPRHWDIGDLSVILDGKDRPAAIMRTLAFHECRFGDVPEDYALDEAEGSYEDYRQGHIRFYRRTAKNGHEFCDDSRVLCERFEVIYWKMYD